LLHLSRSAAVLAFGLIWMSACRSGARSSEIATSEIRVTCEVTPQPVRVGPARVSLTLTDKSGSPVNGATIRIEGHMTHPGMAPVSGGLPQIGPGQYARAFEFTMPGDWALIVQASLAGGEKLERRFDVKGVEAR
jgi:hypothetical protein